MSRLASLSPTLRRSFVSVLLLLLLAAQSSAQGRLALVIGNDAYQQVDTLRKAVNDARTIAASLRRIGFTVLVGENLERREFVRSLAELEARIRPDDLVFFFYAGHGVEIDGASYLLPTDIPKVAPGQQNVLKDEAISTDGLIQRLQARGARSQILVLDACRENPFKNASGRSVGGARGLGPSQPPSGVFIMYSAGIGQVALDRLGDSDTNPNSVFTRTLAPLLEAPEFSLVHMARETRVRVSRLAATVGHLQTPAYYDKIEGDLFLARTPSGAPSPQPAPPVADPVSAPAVSRPPVAPPVIARVDPAPVVPPPARNNDFIFADSDRRMLTRWEIERLPPELRGLALNEIYARRGRFFRDASLRAYFSRFPWYRPHSWDVRLSAIEEANVQLIQSLDR